MFKKLSLKQKMMLSICSLAFITFAFTIATITLRAEKIVKAEAIDKADQIAYRYGGVVKIMLSGAMDSARTTAEAFEGLKKSGQVPDRRIMDSMMKNILEHHPSYVGVWTCWEPNALDNKDAEFAGTPHHDKTGRFVPYWYRTGSKIDVEPLKDYDKSGDGDYYQLALKSGNETILDPYLYPIDGKDVLLTSVVVPIRHEGQVIGVAGVDIILSAMETMIEEIKPFEEGYVFLVSNNGTFVAHPKKTIVGKKIGEFGAPPATIKAIREGTPSSEIKKATATGNLSIVRFVPVNIGNSKTPWSFAITVPMDKVLAGVRSITYISILIGGVSLIIFAIVVFMIANSILKPVNIIVTNLKDIAEGEGDLTKRLDERSQDEIGELAKWFNVFIKKLQGIIGDISKNSENLAESSGSLLAISGEMSEGADNMSTKASTVATAAEEMSTNMTSVAAASEESSTNISMVSAAAEEMTATINEIAQQTDKTRNISATAVERTQIATQNINRLSNAAQQIGQVVETITEISEQTNLLALNATIEAARAGEAGKGFAVVANEIKDLAQQTAEATLEIKEKIGGIQDSTNSTVSEIAEVTAAITSVSEMIGAVAAAVEEQSVTTKEIATNVTQAADGIMEVTENVNQSSSVTNEIAKDIADVNQASTDMDNFSSQVSDNANHLTKLAEDLSRTVDLFKI